MKAWFIILMAFCCSSAVLAQHNANEATPSGFLPQNIKAVDSIVNSFMNQYDVPGLSLAIAQNDSLKLMRTYGYADSVKKEKLTVTSRFRIASISKPFTAAAIMLLVERGKLHLTDKVFGKGSVLGTMYADAPYRKWVTDITIADLLQHLGGGWGNRDNDPMFMHSGLSQAQLIRWTLQNQPLSHRPGTDFQYSNFGYCVLGRVIEKVSGVKYVEFVRKNILSPSGINSMEIGSNTLKQRKPNEVYYYDTEENPYTMDQPRMDSHGGWIATPTDLVNFLMRVDEFPYKLDLLKPATLHEMYQASAVNQNYAKGWAVNKVGNYWHNGSLPGQQSLLARIHSGFCWAVMVNTRKSGDFALDLDQLMWKIKSAIKQWPQSEIHLGR